MVHDEFDVPAKANGSLHLYSSYIPVTWAAERVGLWDHSPTSI